MVLAGVNAVIRDHSTVSVVGLSLQLLLGAEDVGRQVNQT
jgi:hypothetical protein